MDYESILTEEKASIIVKALEEYHLVNRSYPDDINKLIPKYLKQIPKTYILQGNKNFEYYNKDDGGFILQYYYGGYMLKELYNRDNTWYLHPRG